MVTQSSFAEVSILIIVRRKELSFDNLAGYLRLESLSNGCVDVFGCQRISDNSHDLVLHVSGLMDAESAQVYVKHLIRCWPSCLSNDKAQTVGLTSPCDVDRASDNLSDT